jgi:Uncharacterized conserved protein (DUF2285)
LSADRKNSPPRSSRRQRKSGQPKRTGAMPLAAFHDRPPQSASLTDYDRQHLVLYVRLLDAAEEGAEWTEVVHVLFGLNPNQDRERARQIYDEHLARARWMTEHGYWDLLKAAMH